MTFEVGQKWIRRYNNTVFQIAHLHTGAWSGERNAIAVSSEGRVVHTSTLLAQYSLKR